MQNDNDFARMIESVLSLTNGKLVVCKPNEYLVSDVHRTGGRFVYQDELQSKRTLPGFNFQLNQDSADMLKTNGMTPMLSNEELPFPATEYTLMKAVGVPSSLERRTNNKFEQCTCRSSESSFYISVHDELPPVPPPKPKRMQTL